MSEDEKSEITENAEKAGNAGKKVKKQPLRVLVIEDDEDINNLITNWLHEEGIKKYNGYTCGEIGYGQAMQFKYNIVVLDWKLNEKMSGLAVFNRLRQHEHYANVPILIISGFLGKKDFTILEEFPLTGKCEKPLQKNFFIRTLQELYNESLWYQEQEDRIMSLLEKVPEGNPDLIDKLRAVAEKSPNPYHLLCHLGKLLREEKRYKEAEQVLKDGLKYKKHSVTIYNELGKVYLEQGQHQIAKEFLKKAMTLSPDNIERICHLGNISLQEMDLKKADIYFKRAMSLDKSDKNVVSGNKLVKNIENWIATSSSVPDSFASVLNSIGVSMVRDKEYDKGIEHYESAMNHIGDNQTKAKLAFNLGLGYLKWEDPEKALQWFKKSQEFDPNYEKGNKYIKKIENKGVKDDGDLDAINENDFNLNFDLEDEDDDILGKDDYELV